MSVASFEASGAGEFRAFSNAASMAPAVVLSSSSRSSGATPLDSSTLRKAPIGSFVTHFVYLVFGPVLARVGARVSMPAVGQGFDE